MTNSAQPVLDPDWTEAGGVEQKRGGGPGPRATQLKVKVPATGDHDEFKSLPYPEYFGEKKKWVFASAFHGFKKVTELREEVPPERLVRRPWICICLLQVTYRSREKRSATGFLISSAMVATSAHVLFNPKPELGLAAKIVVTPGYLQPDNHRASQTAVERDFRWNRDWGKVPKNFAAAFDYGVIKLPNPTDFSSFGSLVWRAPTKVDLQRPLTISGYPAEKPGPAQWRHTGKIIDQTGELSVFHNIMTTPGQSGSPLFFIGETEVHVCGIHSKASTDLPGANVARRVTAEMMDDYKRWASEFDASSLMS